MGFININDIAELVDIGIKSPEDSVVIINSPGNFETLSYREAIQFKNAYKLYSDGHSIDNFDQRIQDLIKYCCSR